MLAASAHSRSRRRRHSSAGLDPGVAARRSSAVAGPTTATKVPPREQARPRPLAARVTITSTGRRPSRGSWAERSRRRAAGEHRIDWLYSATGSPWRVKDRLDGRLYHIDSLGDGAGSPPLGTPLPSDGCRADRRSGAPGLLAQSPQRRHLPPRRAGGGRDAAVATLHCATSRSRRGIATVALLPVGGRGPGRHPLGSRVHVPAYRRDGHGGWFVAQDTGGAINGRHIDVYRPTTKLDRLRPVLGRAADLRDQAPSLARHPRPAHPRTAH